MEEQATYGSVNTRDNGTMGADLEPVADPLPQEIQSLEPEFLSSYVYSFGHGANKVVDIDAGGYRHIATLLNISIVECDINPNEEGDGLIAKAVAVNLRTNQQYIAHVFQPLKHKNGSPVRSAWEVCNTKVCRNAIRGLIPQALITNAIAHSQQISSGQAEAISPLAKAKDQARKALSNAKGRLAELGITGDQVFTAAQERCGDVAEWTLADWEDFAVDIRNLKRSWIGALADTINEVHSAEDQVEEPKPEEAPTEYV